MSVKFKLALCQMKVVTDKLTNLDKAESMIRSAALNGSRRRLNTGIGRRLGLQYLLYN